MASGYWAYIVNAPVEEDGFASVVFNCFFLLLTYLSFDAPSIIMFTLVKRDC